MGKIVGLAFAAEEEKEKIPCPVCGKAYASEKTLAAHMEKEHPDYKPE